MKEKNIQTEIMLAVSKNGGVIFRNNVGNGVTGQIIQQHAGVYQVINARRIQFGLCPGSSDLIGWKTVEITPAMVGKKLAVFMALEVKTPTGDTRADQIRFIEAVRNAGGLSGIVRSADDAIGVCNPLFEMGQP